MLQCLRTMHADYHAGEFTEDTFRPILYCTAFRVTNMAKGIAWPYVSADAEPDEDDVAEVRDAIRARKKGLQRREPAEILAAYEPSEAEMVMALLAKGYAVYKPSETPADRMTFLISKN